MKKIITLLLALFILLGSAACSKKYGGSLVIYTPNGEALRGVVDAFEEKYGIDVELISLDESDCFKRITKEADKPLADVLYGGLSYENSIKYKEFFEEYTANGDNNLPAEYQNTTGVTTNYCIQAASVILINTNAYEKLGLDASEFDSYQDLLQSELKGNIMFANPEKTAIGYRSLINMLAAMGSDPYDESAWSWVSKFTDQLVDTVNKETTIYFRTPVDVEALNAEGQKIKGQNGENLTTTEFNIIRGNNATCGLSPKTIINLNGDTLFLTKDKQLLGLDLVGIVGDNLT